MTPLSWRRFAPALVAVLALMGATLGAMDNLLVSYGIPETVPNAGAPLEVFAMTVLSISAVAVAAVMVFWHPRVAAALLLVAAAPLAFLAADTLLSNLPDSDWTLVDSATTVVPTLLIVAAAVLGLTLSASPGRANNGFLSGRAEAEK